jgi:hypothetical protein
MEIGDEEIQKVHAEEDGPSSRSRTPREQGPRRAGVDHERARLPAESGVHQKVSRCSSPHWNVGGLRRVRRQQEKQDGPHSLQNIRDW